MALWIKSRGAFDLLPKFFVMAWGVWGRRNTWLYEHTVQHPKLAFEKALDFYFFFWSVKRRQHQLWTRRAVGSPLKLILFKLNSDGANFDDLQAGGLWHCCAGLPGRCPVGSQLEGGASKSRNHGVHSHTEKTSAMFTPRYTPSYCWIGLPAYCVWVTVARGISIIPGQHNPRYQVSNGSFSALWSAI